MVEVIPSTQYSHAKTCLVFTKVNAGDWEKMELHELFFHQLPDVELDFWVEETTKTLLHSSGFHAQRNKDFS